MGVEFDNFEEEFSKKFQCHRVQDGKDSCRNCRHFRAQLQPDQLRMICYGDDDLPIIKRYENGETVLMGGCEKASKMAEKATGLDPLIVLTEDIGHCLFHETQEVAERLNFRRFIAVIQFNSWVREESARREKQRKEIATQVKLDLGL
jgi:hypothetical protein